MTFVDLLLFYIKSLAGMVLVFGVPLLVLGPWLYFKHRLKPEQKELMRECGVTKYPILARLKWLMQKIRKQSFENVTRISAYRRSEVDYSIFPDCTRKFLEYQHRKFQSGNGALSKTAAGTLLAQPLVKVSNLAYYDRFLIVEYSDASFLIAAIMSDVHRSSIRAFYKEAEQNGVQVYDPEILMEL